MPRFADLTIAQFLDELASPNPTPGGGTAVAISGGMAVSLLIMVAGLKKSKTNTEVERAALGAAHRALAPVKRRLLELADADTAAFNQVIAAYRLPKSTDQEKNARKLAVQKALRAATEAPLDTLRAMTDALEHLPTIAQYGNPSASSDVRVALELFEASGAGAAANVEINLTSLDDEAFKKSVAAHLLALTNRIKESTANTRAALVSGAPAT